MAVASVASAGRIPAGATTSSGETRAPSVSRATPRTGAAAGPGTAIVSVKRTVTMLRTRADIAVILPRGPSAFARPRRLGP